MEGSYAGTEIKSNKRLMCWVYTHKKCLEMQNDWKKNITKAYIHVNSSKICIAFEKQKQTKQNTGTE